MFVVVLHGTWVLLFPSRFGRMIFNDERHEKEGQLGMVEEGFQAKIRRRYTKHLHDEIAIERRGEKKNVSVVVSFRVS